MKARTGRAAESDQRSWKAIARIGLSLSLCAFVLNFAWEMMQARYFAGMLEMPWWTATKLCLRASIGDAIMVGLAFCAVALVTRDPRWISGNDARKYAAFMLLAAAQALALERYSVDLGRWRYRPAMPVDPILGLGLAPILQWLILPVLAAWIIRRTSLWPSSARCEAGPEPP
jgi:hypothetical protein